MSRYDLIFSSPIKELDFLSPEITMAKYTTSSSTLIFQYYLLFLFVAPFSFPNIVFCFCLLHHSYFPILFFCFCLFHHSHFPILFFIFVCRTILIFQYYFLFLFVGPFSF